MKHPLLQAEYVRPSVQARRVCAGKRAREDSTPGGDAGGAGHAAKLAKLGGGGAAGKAVSPGTKPVPAGRPAQPGTQAPWAPSPSRLRGSGSGGAPHVAQAAPVLQARPPYALVMWCVLLRNCKAGTTCFASCCLVKSKQAFA